jgi:hypothetical protein
MLISVSELELYDDYIHGTKDPPKNLVTNFGGYFVVVQGGN